MIKGKETIVLHFFVKKLTKEQLENVELNASKADHHYVESLGLFKIPLTNGATLNNFLNWSNFCGNSKDQLIRTIELLNKNNEL